MARGFTLIGGQRHRVMQTFYRLNGAALQNEVVAERFHSLSRRLQPLPSEKQRIVSAPFYQPKTQAKTSGATIVASDSMMYFGVSSESLPQVIFSFGTAPEYEP